VTETAIQKPPPPKPVSLAETIKAKQASFADVATKYLTPERLVKLALVAITKMPDLQKVPAQEIVAELINCARLGLEPNVEGGRWLLPFKRGSDDGTRYELVAVTDYRGLIDIARRSGEVLSIHADIVRANDVWEYWVGSDGPTLVHLRHVRATGDRGAIAGAFAIVRLRNGEVQAEFLTTEQINDAKSRSRGASSKFSPWQRDFDAMAKKTAIRRLYNLLPKTPEIQAAREVLADEDGADRAEIDVTPPPGTRTASVKERLAAKVGRPVAVPAPEAEQADAEGVLPDAPEADAP
jgi:recombination protein RecT